MAVIQGEDMKLQWLIVDAFRYAIGRHGTHAILDIEEDMSNYDYNERYQRISDKISAMQRFLDNLGKWICREAVTVYGTETRLSAFPELSSGRTIDRITRDNSYGTQPQENGVQDWILPITVKYKYEWEKW